MTSQIRVRPVSGCSFVLSFPRTIQLCEIISIHHECERDIEISIPSITDWHHEAFGVVTNGDHEGRIFLSHPHTNNRIIFLANYLIPHFILENTRKDFQKVLNTLRCDMVTSFLHYNDVTDGRAASVRLFVFYHSLGLVRLCEIDISPTFAHVR